MGNPTVIPIAADTWVKIATAVQIGAVEIRNSGPDQYRHDFRVTGSAAPTNQATARSFDKSGTENIASSIPIDVYIYSSGVAGSVLVLV